MKWFRVWFCERGAKQADEMRDRSEDMLSNRVRKALSPKYPVYLVE